MRVASLYSRKWFLYVPLLAAMLCGCATTADVTTEIKGFEKRSAVKVENTRNQFARKIEESDRWTTRLVMCIGGVLLVSCFFKHEIRNAVVKPINAVRAKATARRIMGGNP